MSTFGWVWVAVLAAGVLLLALGQWAPPGDNDDARALSSFYLGLVGAVILLLDGLLLVGRIVWKALV